MDKGFVTNFFKGITSTSIGSVISIAFHFLSIMVMTRFVEKDQLGLFFLLVAVVSYLNIIAGLGLNLTLVRFVTGKDIQSRNNIIATTLFIRFVSLTLLGIIFFLVGKSILPFFDARLGDYIALLIVVFIATNLEEIFLYLMQGRKQFFGYAAIQIFSAFLRFSLLFLLRESLSFNYLIMIEISVLVIAILIQVFLARPVLKDLSPQNVTGETLKSTAKFSAPLYLNNLLTVIYDRSSVLIIGALLNPASVAVYEIAMKVPDGFMRIFSSFIVVFFPSLSGLFAQGKKDDARKLMNHSLVLLSSAILFAVLVSFYFGEEIVLLLFSKEYLEVSLAFALLMLNFFLRAVSNIQGYTLVSAGHPSAPAKVNMISIVINIVSCLIFVPKFGYMGAVFALLLMNLTSLLLYGIQLARIEVSPNIRDYIKPIILFAIAMSVYLVFGNIHWIVKILLLVLYLIASWVLIGEIRKLLRGFLSFLSSRKAQVETV